jgi:hypothetical protein
VLPRIRRTVGICISMFSLVVHLVEPECATYES